MAKKNSKMNRYFSVAGGAVAGLALNMLTKQYTDSMEAGTKENLAKGLPALKMVGGYFMNKNGKGYLQDVGLGLLAEGAVEGALKWFPGQFSLNGVGVGSYYGDEGGYYAEIAGGYSMDDAGGMYEDHVEDVHEVMGELEHDVM